MLKVNFYRFVINLIFNNKFNLFVCFGFEIKFIGIKCISHNCFYLTLLAFYRHHTTYRSPVTNLGKMKIRLVPALQDNYMYLLIDESTKQCAAVDPVEPDKVYFAYHNFCFKFDIHVLKLTLF